MGCCGTFKEEFHLKNFKLEHDQPEQFVRCRWQKKDGISIPYLVYRWLLALYFTVSSFFCFSEFGEDYQSLGRTQKWPIFITNWSYVLDAIQAIVATYLITRALILERRACAAENQKCSMCCCVKAYWILHSTAVVLAIGVTTGYWIAVHDYAEDINALGLLLHGVNSVLMIIDLFLVSHPIRLLHFYCPALVVFIFLIFSLIYFAANGKNKDDEDYIYAALNWNEPLKTSIASLLGLLYIIFLHVLVWLMYLLRQCLFTTCVKKNVSEDLGNNA